MKKSFLSGVALVAAAFAVAGTAHAEDTLKKIKDSGTITKACASRRARSRSRSATASTPASTTTSARTIIADIQKQLGMAKLEIKYQPVTSQNRIPLVQNGTVDLECGSTTNNATRQKDVAFAPTTLRRGSAHRGQGELGHQGHRRPERQDRRDDDRHDLGAAAAQEQARRRHGLQGAHRQGPLRQLPAARVGPRRRVRDGRPDPRRPDLEVEEPGRLQDRRRGALGRADRDHVPQGRPGLQEGGRRQRARHDQERRGRQALRQVVHAADPAEQHQGRPAGVRRDQGGLGEPERQAGRRLRASK